MDLPVRKVEQLNCGACGARIDADAARPLSAIHCPNCDAEVNVPAVFDRYLLLKVIGSGGTGVVLRALDDTLYRQVAIKVLKGRADKDASVLSITREARALAAINDPGIVSIHALGKWRDHHYIVMELLDGGTARKYLAPDNRLTEADALALGARVAQGLAAAHAAGLLHLDVKPANILLSSAGEPKLIDFGAAQYAHRRKGGSVVGTPYYIAPEVLRGRTPDWRADMFSLGGTLFHLLTGSPPFDSTSVHAMIMHRLTHPARSVRDVTSDLSAATEQVIGRMLASDPADRFASYDELIAALQWAADQARSPFNAPPMNTPIRAVDTPRRRRRR